MADEDTIAILIDGRSVQAPRTRINAGDVLALAGKQEGMVVRVDGGRASHFPPEQPVLFGEGAEPAFRTFPDGAIRHLRVEGLLWDWGAPAITEDEVRSIARIGENQVLRLHGAEQPIRRGSVIDLTVAWPPQVEVCEAGSASKADTALVPVTINGRSVTLERPEVTFEDLVGLAFPGADTSSPGSRALTVTYRRGPPARPEGSLVSREKVQVRHGEIFNVTATDKS